METRSSVLFIAGALLIVACSALAVGWRNVAEEATARTAQCERRQRTRVADIPRIVVGIDIQYRGEPVISVAELRDIRTPHITALYQRLRRERRTSCDVAHVCLDNLVVLELVASIDDISTNLIIRTAWAAGYDIIASPPRNTTW
jgi:hypothetical protein